MYISGEMVSPKKIKTCSLGHDNYGALDLENGSDIRFSPRKQNITQLHNLLHRIPRELVFNDNTKNQTRELSLGFCLGMPLV